MSTEKYGSERFHTMQTVKVYDTCTVRVRIDPVRDGKNTISTLTARFNKQPCETLEVPSKTVQQPYASVYICSCTVDATGPLHTDNTVYARCMHGVCMVYARRMHGMRAGDVPYPVWSKIFAHDQKYFFQSRFAPSYTRILPFQHGVYRLYTVIPGNCVRTQPCL